MRKNESLFYGIEVFNIRNRLKELSDLQIQDELWHGKVKGYISSYVELMCSLFDDLRFEEFVSSGAYEWGFSEELIEELKKLETMLKKYDKDNGLDDILADPKWIEISVQAKVVMDKWPKEQVPAMKRVELDLAGIIDLPELYIRLKHAFGIPDWCGTNYHAVYDCLTTLNSTEDDGMTSVKICKDESLILVIRSANKCRMNVMEELLLIIGGINDFFAKVGDKSTILIEPI